MSILENVHKVASELQGIEYCTSPTKDLITYMKQHNIVAVMGASDDLVELYGALDDELGAGKIYITSDGILTSECGMGDNCPYYKKLLASAHTINAVWCGDSGYAWCYETTIPHATFEVFEDGMNTNYCKGIVFSLDNLG